MKKCVSIANSDRYMGQQRITFHTKIGRSGEKKEKKRRLIEEKINKMKKENLNKET